MSTPNQLMDFSKACVAYAGSPSGLFQEGGAIQNSVARNISLRFPVFLNLIMPRHANARNVGRCTCRRAGRRTICQRLPLNHRRHPRYQNDCIRFHKQSQGAAERDGSILAKQIMHTEEDQKDQMKANLETLLVRRRTTRLVDDKHGHGTL